MPFCMPIYAYIYIHTYLRSQTQICGTQPTGVDGDPHHVSHLYCVHLCVKGISMVVHVLAGIMYITHVCKCTFVGMKKKESRHTCRSKNAPCNKFQESANGSRVSQIVS